MKPYKPLLPILFVLMLANITFSQSRFYGTVTEVIDGKMLVIQPQPKVNIKIELQYIEVPESEQPLHDIVQNHLKNMVLNKYVEFIPKNLNEQKPVGQVLLNGIDISQQMIRDGAAWYSIAEKHIQNENESKLYQDNEALAKAEKRGIWGVPNLKPAWEFRAEKEEQLRLEELKKLEEEKARQAEIAKNRPRPRNSRQTAEEREQANANVEIWADTSDYGFMMSYASKMSESEGNPGSLEPITQYNSGTQIGYMGTQLSILNITSKDDKHKLLAGILYAYQNEGSQIKNSNYVLVIISESPEEKFVDAYNLTIFADKKKVYSDGAKRSSAITSTGVREVLIYRIRPEDLNTIKQAKTLGVDFGGYKATASEAFVEKIQTLLDKLK